MDTTTTAISVEQIGLDLLHRNPDQPRQFFDENALDELAASIRQHGLLEPIVVRPRAEGGYTIVAGERRWRAGLRGGIDAMPCSVLRDMSDEDAFVLSVTENVTRADMTCIEEAQSYARIQAAGRTVEQVAALFGKTKETIQVRMDLLALREDLQHLAATGQLSVGPAWYMSRLSQAGQAEILARIMAGGLPTNDDICRASAAVRLREESPAMFERKPLDPLVEAKRRVHRTKIQTAWTKVETIGPAISQFLELSPEELALAVGDDVPLYHKRVELLYKTIRQVSSLMRQAQAVHEAQKSADAA
jgi:ParB family chromosome partitioning protein